MLVPVLVVLLSAGVGVRAKFLAEPQLIKLKKEAVNQLEAQVKSPSVASEPRLRGSEFLEQGPRQQLFENVSKDLPEPVNEQPEQLLLRDASS